MDSTKTFWRFPAFPPFLERVLHDLRKVYGESLIFSPESNEWIDNQKTEDEWIAYAQDTALPGPYRNYEHQNEGLGKLLHNYRYILQWEMGTGKTKPVIDLAFLLREKMLVMCPLVAAKNWEKEVQKHTGGALKARALLGTRKQNMKKLNDLDDVDVVIVTYDYVRLWGVPFLAPKALQRIMDVRKMPPPEHVENIIKRVNDPATQLRLTEEWLTGRKVNDIKQEVVSLIHGKIHWLIQLKRDIIVADESHRLKQINSQRSGVALQLSGRYKRRYLLSGTLSLGDPRDLYPQLRFLAPYTIPEDYQKFTAKHVIFSERSKHVVLGFQNLNNLNRVVTGISSRRELDECVDLPTRTFERIPYSLSKAQLRDYNLAVEEMIIDHPDADPLELQNGAVRLAKLLQICSGFVYSPLSPLEACDSCEKLIECFNVGILPGSRECIHEAKVPDRETLRYPTNPKLETLSSFLDDLLENPKHKVIIWAYFEAELDDIEGMLKKKKSIDYVRVDGTTASKVAEKEEKFQGDPKCVIYLGQIKTGISITLTAAKYTVYYSRSWSLEDWLQSRNRNYRIGQKEKTVVYNLCGNYTVEGQQIRALKAKKDVSMSITKHLNCMVCARYSFCLEQDIEQWGPGCIFQRKMGKGVTLVRSIYD